MIPPFINSMASLNAIPSELLHAWTLPLARSRATVSLRSCDHRRKHEHFFRASRSTIKNAPHSTTTALAHQVLLLLALKRLPPQVNVGTARAIERNYPFFFRRPHERRHVLSEPTSIRIIDQLLPQNLASSSGERLGWAGLLASRRRAADVSLSL